MAKLNTKSKLTNEVFGYLATIAAILCVIVSGLAFWAHMYIGDMVRTELAAQKIYFPDKGTPGFDAATYPDLQRYAGQAVDTPDKAKAYANGYIGRHLENIAGGKVYSEVSAAAMKDPANKQLQQQRQTLFQGETLRGILLTSGFGFGTIGIIAGIAAAVFMVLGGLLVVTALYLRTRR